MVSSPIQTGGCFKRCSNSAFLGALSSLAARTRTWIPSSVVRSGSPSCLPVSGRSGQFCAPGYAARPVLAGVRRGSCESCAQPVPVRASRSTRQPGPHRQRTRRGRHRSSLLGCDACAFRDALEAGDPQRALDLYAGDLLPGLHIDSPDFERWLASERASFREDALTAALELGARATGTGATAEAAHFYRRALEIAPESALAARHLVEALWQAGRRLAAIEAYERFAAFISSEYGVEPGSELKELMARVRAGDRSPGSASPAVRPPGQASTNSRPEETGRHPPDQASPTPRQAGTRIGIPAWTRIGIPLGIGILIIVVLGMWLGQTDRQKARAAFEANLDYQRAWAAWESRQVDSAHVYLERAVALDPEHARAWALLSYVSLLLNTSRGMPAGEALPASRRAAQRAIELDSSFAAAWHTRATTKWASWDWEGAARDYRHTLECRPAAPGKRSVAPTSVRCSLISASARNRGKRSSPMRPSSP